MGSASKNDYLVIYEQGEDGAWGAHAPDLEGVFALGRTREECEDRMRGAMALHLEVLQADGVGAPTPACSAGYISA
jgi:predicted RNase H-like HicB family nuclease